MEEINKQEQIFLSECPRGINSREIHLHLTFSSKRNKCAKVWKNAKSFLGFVQILELLKVLKFAEQFSSLGKSLVNGVKSVKME